jgi:hypothetical protein
VPTDTASKDIHEIQARRVEIGQEERESLPGTLERPASQHRAELEKIRNGLATKVRILVNADCCPVCRSFEGAYELDNVPALPQEGCSHPQGCRCYYAPVLDRFGP